MIFSQRTVGIFEALLSATFFGLIPVLFIPVYEAGISPETSLIYRFGFAALMMLVPITFKKLSLKVSLKNHGSIAICGFSYYIAALLLYTSFTYIASGITVTIFFINPIFVMVLMAIFYKEKIEFYKMVLSLSTLVGIALFSGVFTSDEVLNITGMTLAILSSLGFAFYVLVLFTLQGATVSKEVVSFYLFAWCTVCACLYSFSVGQIAVPTSGFVLSMLALSALITAVLPNVLLMSAMKKIGSVLATILGVMDPITAVIIGVLVFGEPVDVYIVSGIVLVLVSVMLITVLPMLRAAGGPKVYKV